MKINQLISGVAIVAIAAGCVTGLEYNGAAAKVAPKHVIFVGWDGFAGNTLAPAKAPVLKKLMAEGAWTDRSRSILPSASACCWHSLFTCSASEQHGYNAWNSKKPVFNASSVGPNGMYPDIFYLLKRQHPSSEVGFIYDWDGMGFVADTNACDYVQHMGQSKLTDAAIKYITEKKPTFFAVCYDSPDNFGHSKGWGSPEYLARVTELDTDLGKILDAIKAAGMLEDTVVVVSSDHGGIKRGHGGPSLSEMERPVVIWGKGVKRGYQLKFPGTIYDTGATLAALLGIRAPQAWIGRPFDEAFEDADAK